MVRLNKNRLALYMLTALIVSFLFFREKFLVGVIFFFFCGLLIELLLELISTQVATYKEFKWEQENAKDDLQSENYKEAEKIPDTNYGVDLDEVKMRLESILRPTKAVPSRYKRKRKGLLTKAEQKFYWHLKSCVGDEYHIFCQVALNQIVESKTGSFAEFGKIGRKSIDYIICDDEMRVLCAIELDDYTHNWLTQQKYDKSKNEILEDAAIPLIRVKGTYPSKTEVLAIIDGKY